jgi:pimeloyl-ACP methyl ester carboxylesterase
METRAVTPAESRPAAIDPWAQASGRSPQGVDDPIRAFEERRLAAFRSRGFVGVGRRIPDLAGRETYVLISGESPCPTVLVHGGAGNTVEWADVAPKLVGPVVIPDRPGFGLSYPHDYRRVDYRADAARWLLELADGLGVDRIDLVGNSMGGFFAIAFATAHPERVRRLALCGSPGGLFPKLGLFLQLWATPGIGALISKIRFRDAETLRRRLFGNYVVHPERVAADLLDVALLGINLPGTADTNRAILQAVATFRGWRPEMRLDDALAALAVPTLFVWGDSDQLSGVGIAQDLATRMPDARIDVIPHAGHIPHLDQPGPVAAALNEFLRNPSVDPSAFAS